MRVYGLRFRSLETGASRLSFEVFGVEGFGRLGPAHRNHTTEIPDTKP